MKEIDVGVGAEQTFLRLVEAAEKLYPLFVEDEKEKARKAVELLKRKIIPLLRHECPLLVAVTGGGSVGKSTLFNMLAGGEFSGVKSRAGYTRRTLAAIHPSVAGKEERMALLFELFKKNAVPVPLKSPDEMLEPGNPLFVESANIPERIAVLDTPDFDTGNGDEFANRDAAEEILAVSDVLLYLFTNQTYNNKANTDFVRNAISGIGRRKVVLVYRCSPAYSEEEVREHMDVVLRNLFPESGNPRSEALGLYRVDESNAVVKGDAVPVLRPLSGGSDIMSLINGLDIAEVRRETLVSQCQAVIDEMNEVLDKVSDRRNELVAYRDSVKALARDAVLDGFKNFPQSLLMELFVDCWRNAQPGIVRLAHWTGRRISAGMDWLLKKFRDKSGTPGNGRADATGAKEYGETFRGDFRDCVQKLRAKLSLRNLSVEVSSRAKDAEGLLTAVKALAARHEEGYGFSESGKHQVQCSVSRPSMLAQTLDAELQAMADAGDDDWIEQAVEIVCQNQDVMKDISALVDETRRNMGIWERSKEGLWAMVAVLPPIVAVTWVVCTSDPVVGPGVTAHLSAMFGLGDLYAVLALPASWGLDDGNKALLKSKLKTLFEVWFERKREPICNLIDEKMTSRCIRPCDDLLKATEAPFNRLREAVAKLA